MPSFNRNLAGLINTFGDVKLPNLDNMEKQVIDSGGVSTTIRNSNIATSVYTSIDDLPTTGLSKGQQALVTTDSNNARYYLSNGLGWYNVALVNTSPSVTFDLDQYILDSADDVITVTVTDSDFDQANLQDLTIRFEPPNITDSALNYSVNGNTVTLSLKESATGTYAFKMFGSKSDGNAIATDSADVDITLFVVTSIGTLYQAPTNTQMIVTGNKTSSVSATDTISKADGTNEVTVTAVTWPDNNTSAGSAASDNHGSGTVRREGGDYRSTFTNGRLISNSSSFASYGTITGSTYSNYTTTSTTWTTQSGNGTAYVYGYIRGQAGWNGLYVSGGIPGFSTGTWAANNSGTGSISLPYAAQNRYYPTTNTFTQLTVNLNYNVAGLSSNQTTAGGNQASTVLGKMVGLSTSPSSNLYGYVTNAVYSSANNYTIITFDNSGSYPISTGQQFGSGQGLYYANAVAVKFYRMTTYGAGSFGTGITTAEHIRANRTFYKSTTTSTTTYYTQINYSGGGDLFNSGTSIRVGDNRTDITIASGGTNYSNGETIYKKT